MTKYKIRKGGFHLSHLKKKKKKSLLHTQCVQIITKSLKIIILQNEQNIKKMRDR